MFKKQKSHKGFTIPEVLIAIMILSMTTVASLNLIIHLFKLSDMNNNRIIATNLAREGIELVRNQRDSNWLEWSGSLREMWNTGFDGMYDVNAAALTTQDTDPTNAKTLVFSVQRAEPFKMLFIDDGDFANLTDEFLFETKADETHLYYKDGQGYRHYVDSDDAIADGAEPSAFYRAILVTYYGDDNIISNQDNYDGTVDANTVQIISKVGYKYNNDWKSITLETYLTDWYMREDKVDL